MTNNDLPNNNTGNEEDVVCESENEEAPMRADASRKRRAFVDEDECEFGGESDEREWAAAASQPTKRVQTNADQADIDSLTARYRVEFAARRVFEALRDVRGLGAFFPRSDAELRQFVEAHALHVIEDEVCVGVAIDYVLDLGLLAAQPSGELHVASAAQRSAAQRQHQLNLLHAEPLAWSRCAAERPASNVELRLTVLSGAVDFLAALAPECDQQAVPLGALRDQLLDLCTMRTLVSVEHIVELVKAMLLHNPI